MTIKATILPTVVTILLTFAMCNSKDKFGTYKLSTRTGNATFILYKDSTFTEKILSDTIDGKCEGQWMTVNQKDSIIATITWSCGVDIYTTPGRRTLKIDGDKLIEVSE
jgi:hypothetical protein